MTHYHGTPIGYADDHPGVVRLMERAQAGESCVLVVPDWRKAYYHADMICDRVGADFVRLDRTRMNVLFLSSRGLLRIAPTSSSERRLQGLLVDAFCIARHGYDHLEALERYHQVLLCLRGRNGKSPEEIKDYA